MQIIKNHLLRLDFVRAIACVRYINRNHGGKEVILLYVGRECQLIHLLLNLLGKKNRVLTADGVMDLIKKCGRAGFSAGYYFFVPKNKQMIKQISQMVDKGIDSCDCHYLWFPYPDINEKMDAFDPLLGFMRKDDVAGCTIWGGNNSGVTVVILGNSTSDSTFAGCVSWAEYLYNRFKDDEELNIKVIDAAMIRTNSSQELLKLIRDIIPQHPDIVVSFSGVCNVDVNYEKFLVKGHPYVWDYSAKLMESKVLNRCIWHQLKQKTRIKAISYGMEDKRPFAKWWVDDIRMMHAICEEFGIEFYSILQPSVYEGEYSANGFEHIVYNEEYITRIKQWYSEVRQILGDANLHYVWDFTDVFNGMRNVYWDSCHVFEKGNRIIADEVYNRLKKISNKL